SRRGLREDAEIKSISLGVPAEFWLSPLQSDRDGSLYRSSRKSGRLEHRLHVVSVPLGDEPPLTDLESSISDGPYGEVDAKVQRYTNGGSVILRILRLAGRLARQWLL